VLFEGLPGDLVAMALDLEGIGVSTGSACASGAHETSAVLKAMGLTGTPVRFSLGPDTTVDDALGVVPRVIGKLRASL
jgi:cysteine desulfurase